MSFNGSFGEGEFVDEDDNSNILSLKTEDFKVNYEEGGVTQNCSNSNIKTSNNIKSDLTINSNTNNIFSSVPMEMEIDSEYQNSNYFYDSLLSKELIKYHLSNIFNILKSKIIIINSQTFYFFKQLSTIKLNNLIKAEILYLKISSTLSRISKIFKTNRINILYNVFFILKTKFCLLNNNKNNNDNDTFRSRFEIKYKKEKNNTINENNNSIKKLEKDIKDIENNIKMLTIKENELKTEINNCFLKEKQLNDKIKTIENSTNTVKKSLQSCNISPISSNSKYDSEIHSLETTIETNKQLKEGKEEIIKMFMKQVNDLINEYQVYIDNINNINNRNNGKNNINSENNLMNIELNENINQKI